MEPTSIMATGVPSATSWYMNPYFAASFGAVVALGCVIFALAYFVFVKLKVGNEPKVETGDRDKCAQCGLSSELMDKLVPCKFHGEIAIRTATLEREIKELKDDYREQRRRIDAIERGNNRGVK